MQMGAIAGAAAAAAEVVDATLTIARMYQSKLWAKRMRSKCNCNTMNSLASLPVDEIKKKTVWELIKEKSKATKHQ